MIFNFILFGWMVDVAINIDPGDRFIDYDLIVIDSVTYNVIGLHFLTICWSKL
jgi:hypothetical protein